MPYPGPDDEPGRDRSFYLQAASYDSCAQTYHYYISQRVDDVPAQAFKLDGALRQASLEVKASVYDYVTGMQLPLTLDLTWTGTGERVSDNFHWEFENQWFRYLANGHGDYRPASFSGNLVIGQRAVEISSNTGWLSDRTNAVVRVEKQ